MNIPDCYDPACQEERRQAAADARTQNAPICTCCGHRIRYGERMYTLELRKIGLTVCEDCKADMDDSERFMEEEDYV